MTLFLSSFSFLRPPCLTKQASYHSDNGCAIFYNFLHAILNAVFLFYIDKQQLLKSYYLLCGLSSVTKMLLYLGFFLYATNRLSEAWIGYFVYPDIFLRLGLYCSRSVQSSTMQTIPLLHSFSLLIIAGFIEDKSLLSLSMAFMIYYFYGVFFASIVILMSMLLGFLIKVYLTAPAMLNTFVPDLLDMFLRKIAAYFLFCCWFTYHTITYCMFVWGVHQFLAQGHMRPHPLEEKVLPMSLGVAGIGLKILGYLDLVIFATALVILKDQLRALMDKFKGKEITFQSFKENLQLNLQKRGENYFKRSSGTLEPLVEMQEHVPASLQQQNTIGTLEKFGECQICMTNTCNTWFEPCGHTVVCQQCLNEFLQKFDTCVMCRGKIDKVHLIYWDSQARVFKSKGAYTLKAS